MNKLLTLSQIIFLILFNTKAEGKTIQVPIEYTNIQEAINASANGDTVLVDPGTYTENIKFKGKNIVVASKYVLEENTEYILNTIIDGSHGIQGVNGSCVAFVNGEDSSAVIQGFTLTKGSGTGGDLWSEGGGVHARYASSATIKNNLIINNNVINGGAGITALNNSTLYIYNNIIANNYGAGGGGICINRDCGGIIRNNIIYNNSINPSFGGGIRFHESNKKLYIENNTIVGNSTTTTGGGIHSVNVSSSENMFINNNIIRNNMQGYGEEINLVSGIKFTYNNTSQNMDGSGNITSYPDFSEVLLQLNTTSNCIDAGNPDTTYNDVDGSRNDMGAYGGPYAKPFPQFENESIGTPYRVAFPVVYVNASVDTKIEITNIGTLSLKIDSIGFDQSKFKLNSTIPDMLKPMECYSFDLTWTPETEGNLLDSLKIYHQFKYVINPVCVPMRGIALASTGIHENQSPNAFHLGQNYPNPFNPSTQINYSLKEYAFTSLTISDIRGRVVKTLVNDFKRAGHYEIILNGTDLVSGVYFYQLQANEFTDRKKLMILK